MQENGFHILIGLKGRHGRVIIYDKNFTAQRQKGSLKDEQSNSKQIIYRRIKIRP